MGPERNVLVGLERESRQLFEIHLGQDPRPADGCGPVVARLHSITVKAPCSNQHTSRMPRPK